MTTVGHPHLGPRRHWANQRSRPCHSRAWAQARALNHRHGSLAGLAAATPEAHAPTSVLARALGRLHAWLPRR